MSPNNACSGRLELGAFVRLFLSEGTYRRCHYLRELNVAFWDPEAVRTMRVELFQEHLATDTSAMDDTGALLLFRQIACENRKRHERSDPNWQGLAFHLDAATYGQASQF